MGFDYSYQNGNMFIPRNKINEVDMPLLIAKYEVADDAIGRRVVHMQEFRQERNISVPLDGDGLRVEALLHIIAGKHDWVASYHKKGDLFDQGGDGIALYFDTMNSGDYSDWLDDLAPYIQSGTYATISDDDGSLFRLVARNGTIDKIYPTWNM